MTKSRGINRTWHRWTKRENAILRRDYPHKPTQEIATALGLSLQQVYSQSGNLHLHKSAVYLASPNACRLRRGGDVGKAYRYPKGHVPANKGLRRPGWFAGRMRETQFKKGTLNGHAAQHYQPIGSERINAAGYRELKVSDTGLPHRRWKAVHRLLWEEACGPIPPRHLVVFKDGDKTNIVIENLELITLTENGRRNVMWRNYPKELAHVLQLRGAVQKQINRRLGRKQEKNRERREATRRALRNARRTSGQGQPDGHRAGEGRRASG